MPGALWSRDAIERARVDECPALRRVVVAIDPAASAGDEADETGIVVAGARSGRPRLCARRSLGPLLARMIGRARALEAYRAHRADRIVAEINNGGAMVEATLRVVGCGRFATSAVTPRAASSLRAEPVAALYEQGRVHHVGAFPALEDQMCAFTGGRRCATSALARPRRRAGLGAVGIDAAQRRAGAAGLLPGDQREVAISYQLSALIKKHPKDIVMPAKAGIQRSTGFPLSRE